MAADASETAEAPTADNVRVPFKVKLAMFRAVRTAKSAEAQARVYATNAKHRELEAGELTGAADRALREAERSRANAAAQVARETEALEVVQRIAQVPARQAEITAELEAQTQVAVEAAEAARDAEIAPYDARLAALAHEYNDLLTVRTAAAATHTDNIERVKAEGQRTIAEKAALPRLLAEARVVKPAAGELQA